MANLALIWVKSQILPNAFVSYLPAGEMPTP